MSINGNNGRKIHVISFKRKKYQRDLKKTDNVLGDFEYLIANLNYFVALC